MSNKTSKKILIAGLGFFLGGGEGRDWILWLRCPIFQDSVWMGAMGGIFPLSQSRGSSLSIELRRHSDDFCRFSKTTQLIHGSNVCSGLTVCAPSKVQDPGVRVSFHPKRSCGKRQNVQAIKKFLKFILFIY